MSDVQTNQTVTNLVADTQNSPLEWAARHADHSTDPGHGDWGRVDASDEPDEVAATGATAGTPGTFTPSGATPPANVAGMTGLTASPNTAWTTGQYVQTATAGAPGQAHWSGSAWVAGPA